MGGNPEGRLSKRENALRIIRFDDPEYVMTGVPGYELRYNGANHEDYAGVGEDLPVGSRWRDIWGTVWHKTQEGVMSFPVEYPLASPANLAPYAWPNPNDERVCGTIYALASTFRDSPGRDALLEGSFRDTLWEKAYMLVGMENLMAYMFEEPAFAHEVFERVMDFQLGVAAHYVKCGVEIARLSDDLGTQRAPLLGMDMVAEFLEPQYKRLFAFLKGHGVLVNFHSCGYIQSAIPMFLRLGVNVLNPVQATANDLAAVRAATDGKIALCGGVPSHLLMDGPAEAIRADVRDKIRLLGARGGYFCAPDQGLPWPQEHYAAFESAVREFGRYR